MSNGKSITEIKKRLCHRKKKNFKNLTHLLAKKQQPKPGVLITYDRGSIRKQDHNMSGKSNIQKLNTPIGK